MYTKMIYDLTTATINNCLQFQNDWFKIIRNRYRCMQFCSLLLCWRNRKYLTSAESLEHYEKKLLALVYVKMQPNEKFLAMPYISFYARAGTKFVSHTNTQAFCKNCEILSRTSQMSYSIKSRKIESFQDSNTFFFQRRK